MSETTREGIRASVWQCGGYSGFQVEAPWWLALALRFWLERCGMPFSAPYRITIERLPEQGEG